MNRFGSSAIQLAAETNHEEIAKLLIRWGCDPAIYRCQPLGSVCCRNFTDEHPHLELEPLYCSVQNDNFRLMKLLVYAHHKPLYADLHTLRDLVFRTGYAQEVGLQSRVIQKYTLFFNSILSCPSPLKALCRGAVRKCVGHGPSEKIKCLPLPLELKKYVLLDRILV